MLLKTTMGYVGAIEELKNENQWLKEIIYKLAYQEEMNSNQMDTFCKVIIEFRRLERQNKV
jgi:hypothetical protein